jgi:hypothetical protein
MKKLLLFALNIGAYAQTSYNVTITWVDTINPPTATTYNLYRATNSNCTGNPTFSQIANGIAGSLRTYTDQGLAPGNYCYAIRGSIAGREAAQLTEPAYMEAVQVQSMAIVVTRQNTTGIEAMVPTTFTETAAPRSLKTVAPKPSQERPTRPTLPPTPNVPPAK